jgi:hypothetical protein
MNKQSMNEQQGIQAIPCARCGMAPALLDCAIKVSAFGLGEMVVYLCRKDYEEVIAKQQRDEARSGEVEQERAHFQQMCQQVAAQGLRLHGGQWPPRQALWDEHASTGKQHDDARATYWRASDTTDEGKAARLRVLRLAGLCLYEAICIEAAAREEGARDSAVNSTLTRATYVFLKKGLTIPGKQITRPQVIAAMWTVLHYRETHPEHEQEELTAIDREMSRGDV